MKLVLGSLLAALVVLGWHFVSWSALGWHENNTFGFANEDVVAEAIADNARSGHGRYMLPHQAEVPSFLHPTEKAERAKKLVEARDEGPFLYAIVRPGKKPWSLTVAMGWTLVRGFLGALIVSLLLSQTSLSYGAKVGFTAAMGAFAGIAGQLPMWIWFEESGAELFVQIADLLFEWTLAGLVIALFAGKPEVNEP